MTDTKTLWFDMDGVLALYERNAYISTTPDPPLYLQPDRHYFRTVIPDRKMIAALDLLQHKSAHDVRIITTISPNPIIKDVQISDKIEWLGKYCPFINVETQFFATDISKHERVLSIINHTLFASDKQYMLTPNQILIDDFNKNLTNWQTAGGVAIKYLNGINSPSSFNGPLITEDMSDPLTIAKFLATF